MQNENKTTALALRPAESASFSTLNYAEAWALAGDIAERLHKSALIPTALRGKPADITICIMTGYELGLGPFQSMRGINVIQGKAALAADLIAALVQRSSAAEYFQPSATPDETCTYVTRRKGSSQEVEMTFDKAMAQKAGLWGKGNWRSYPAAMLRARCATALARAVYPDSTFGLYDPDELGIAVETVGTGETPPEPVDEKAPPTKTKRKRRTKAQMQADKAEAEAKAKHEAEKANGYQSEAEHDPETGEVIDAEVIELSDHRDDDGKPFDWDAEVLTLHAELAEADKQQALDLLPRLKKVPDGFKRDLHVTFNEAMKR